MHGYLMTQTLILFSVLIIFLRQNPHEVYINPFNLRGKMIEFIQYRFLFSPIEFSQPMLTNCFHIFRLESVFKIAIFKVAPKRVAWSRTLRSLISASGILMAMGFMVT